MTGKALPAVKSAQQRERVTLCAHSLTCQYRPDPTRRDGLATICGQRADYAQHKDASLLPNGGVCVGEEPGVLCWDTGTTHDVSCPRYRPRVTRVVEAQVEVDVRARNHARIMMEGA